MLDVFLASSLLLAGHSVLTFPPDLRQWRVSKSKQFSEAKAQAARTASLLFLFQRRGSTLDRAASVDPLYVSGHVALDLLSCLTAIVKVVSKGPVGREEVSVHHSYDLFQKQKGWKACLKTLVSKR